MVDGPWITEVGAEKKAYVVCTCGAAVSRTDSANGQSAVRRGGREKGSDHAMQQLGGSCGATHSEICGVAGHDNHDEEGRAELEDAQRRRPPLVVVHLCDAFALILRT